MEDFSNSVVIVTGACGGIGEAISSKFADAGAALGLCDIRERELEQLAARLSSQGVQVYHRAIDVTDQQTVRDFCDASAQTLGRIDHLINTVGVVDNTGDVVDLPLNVWERTLAVNLTSAFLMAKYTVPHLISAGGGSIVNISSVSGLANQVRAMAYSVSKAGLISLTKSQAIDLARHHIRANAICPGSVETSLVDEAIALTARESGRTIEETRKDWESQYPTSRFSRPADVAEMALFLCSPRASNITGASLVVDMENGPCKYPGEIIERHFPGAGKRFPKAARHLRGVTGWIERPGRVAVDDAVQGGELDAGGPLSLAVTRWGVGNGFDVHLDPPVSD